MHNRKILDDAVNKRPDRLTPHQRSLQDAFVDYTLNDVTWMAEPDQYTEKKVWRLQLGGEGNPECVVNLARGECSVCTEGTSCLMTGCICDHLRFCASKAGYSIDKLVPWPLSLDAWKEQYSMFDPEDRTNDFTFPNMVFLSPNEDFMYPAMDPRPGSGTRHKSFFEKWLTKAGKRGLKAVIKGSGGRALGGKRARKSRSAYQKPGAKKSKKR